MTLKGINNNVDLACTGLPDAAPSSILASPLASICLQKLHKPQHMLCSHSSKSRYNMPSMEPKLSQFRACTPGAALGSN